MFKPYIFNGWWIVFYNKFISELKRLSPMNFLQKTLLVFGALAFIASPSIADDQYCAGTSTQMGISQCAVLEMEKADVALTHVYQRLLKVTTPKEKLQLRKAERAWIIFRDETCNFIGLSRDSGSMQGMVIAMCRTEMIKGQTRKLTWQLTCRETGEDCSSY